MRTLTMIISLLLAALGVSIAQAHAVLDHASPQVGGTVPTAPRELTLSFTQNVEPTFSSVEVVSTSGARVDAGKAWISGNTMQVELKPLPPGTYHVHWRVISVYTHAAQGSFSFRVGGS